METATNSPLLRVVGDVGGPLFTDAVTAMLLVDPAGQVIRANDAACALLGRRRTELEGAPFSTVKAPEDLPNVQREFSRLLTGELPEVSREGHYLRTDGTVATGELHTTTVNGPDGEPLGFLLQIQDTTLRSRTVAALRRSEELYRLLARNLPAAAVILVDARLRVLVAEGAPLARHGYPMLEGRRLPETLSEQGRVELLPRYEDALAGHSCDVDYVMDGGRTTWRIQFVPVRDERAVVVAAMAIAEDVTDLRAAQTQLAESERRARIAMDDAPIGMALVALDGRWTRVNRALCRITGYSEGELLARTFQDITHPDDLDLDLSHVQRLLAGELTSYSIEKRYLRKDRSYVWARLSVSLMRDEAGSPAYFIAQIEDIDEAKRMQRSLEDLALHDQLTGAANRSLLLERLDAALLRERRDGHVCVLYCDLDRFKEVNDRLGHAGGDEVLRVAAARLRAALRPTDLVGRLGGDEFVAVCDGVSGLAEAQHLAERVRAHVAEPIGIDGAPVRVTISVGLALASPGETAADLLRGADTAMYAAKGQGRDRTATSPRRVPRRRDGEQAGTQAGAVSR